MRAFFRVGLGALAAMCLLIGTAWAQSIGAKAGLSRSDIVFTGDSTGVESEPSPRFVIGGLVTFRSERRLALQAEAQLTERRLTTGNSVVDRITYVEMPALARYRVWSRGSMHVHALGGLSVNYLVKARESFFDFEEEDVTEAFKSWEVATVVGADIEFNGRWFADVRYIFGLTRIYETPDFPAKQRGLQITGGYRFR